MSDILQSAMAALGYVPTHLPESQIKQESGGRQKDKSGKTLVGKYRDGSMPAPDKRAYGVSQMQIATAKSTAAAHGIAWDENKFMNDRDYNLRLGDLHQGDLNKKYGGYNDKSKAAYHSGEGNVNRAIERARREGGDWQRFLGPHGREYIGYGGKGASGGGSQVAGLSIPDILRSQGRTDGAGPTESNLPGTGNLPQDASRVRNRAEAADDVLSQAISGLQNVQETETQALAARNERVDGILTEQAARVTDVQNRMAPLFQQRRAVIEQKDKVRTMNPIARAFKGLFDPNYDESQLNDVQTGIDEKLQNDAKEYETMIGLQDRLLQIVNTSYQGVTMETALQTQHLNQDIELAAKSLTSANALMSSSMDMIQSDRTIRAANIELANQVLSEATPGQISTWHAQAQKDPNGTVTVNGAVLSEGLLRKAGVDFAESQLRLDQLVLARQAQNKQLEDRAIDDLIGTMNTSQIRAAINAGGQFNGQQLPLDKLGAGLQRSMGRDELMVAGSMTQGSIDTFNFMRKSIGNQTQIAGMRAAQLTGTVPPAINNVIMSQNPRLQQIMDKIKAAPPELKEQMASQYLPELQKMGAERQKVIEDVATKWAGSNAAVKPLALAFLSGSPLNGEDAAKGIISMVRSGMNFANASPEAQAALNAAKRVIAQRQAAKSKAGALPFGAKLNAKQEEAELNQAVMKALTDTYTQQTYSRVLQNIPQVAKATGHLAQNLDPAIIRQAQDAGDEEGYRQMGQELGIGPADAKRLFTGGDAELWAKVAPKANGRTLDQLGVALSLRQSMFTAQYLDQNHPKIGKFPAGAVYTKFLADPRFADAAGNAIQRQGQQGFGDFAVSALGSGGVVGQIQAAGEVGMRAYNQLNTNRGMRAALKANEYNADPFRRTATILGALPDLQPDEERVLLQAVKPVIESTGPRPGQGRFIAGMEIPMAPNNGTFELVRRAIVNGKFEDPVVEKIRAKAAKQFDVYAKVTDDAFDRFGNYAPEE